MTEDNFQRTSQLACSAIVTTWQRPALLRNTIHSLLQQTYPRLEIVVVCDGEDADVRSMAQEFNNDPIRWFFHPTNRGLPAARNTGVRQATGEIVLFLDDDVVADGELVSTHMQHHQTNGQDRTIAVISLTREERQTPLTSYVNECLHKSWTNRLDGFAASLGATGVESVGEEIERIIYFGLNCSIRRDVFIREGGFNEHFRSSDEEMEMGLRLYTVGVEFIFECGLLLKHLNVKDLRSYFQSCWSASGALDFYRVFELGQKNAQTRHLVSIFSGDLLSRTVSRIAWHLSFPLRSLSGILETAANRTRSYTLFSIWTRITQPAEYWTCVKEAGGTLKKLQRVARPAKCALLLHSISEPQTNAEESYYVAPNRFRRLMHWFRGTGHKTATVAQYLLEEMDEDQVLFTFDDGYDDLYEELMPLAAEHGYTALIFLVANCVGGSNVWDQKTGLRTRNLLTLDQIREMQKHGFEFGSHTLNHPWLPSLSNAELRHEIYDSKHRLEDALGGEVVSFAYPRGGVDQRVRSAVADAGYKLAFTTIPGLNFWNDPLCQRRAEINGHTSLLDFISMLRAGRPAASAFSARLKRLEEELPSKFMRSAVKGIRRIGRNAASFFAERN
jgi:peptidoglycan/xylan/chitin deacetylase (PgdA/CDA1 family)/GT2 family glycosyltransferase